MTITADETVKALRKSCQGCGPTPCCEFEVLGDMAVDLIESLQAQLATKETVNCLYSATIDLLSMDRDEAIRRMQRAEAQLTESQRRERAAVEDIEMLLKVNEQFDDGETKYVCHFCANGDCKGVGTTGKCEPKWREPMPGRD
jgi:hypothetical protein